MAGFTYRYRLSGTAPTIQKLEASESVVVGDVVNLESGDAALGATLDTDLLGTAQNEAETGEDVDVIVDADAVYGVEDANARVKGDTLDLTGTSGAQGVAASTNKEFVVVAASSASEETLVRFNVGSHHDNTAQ